MTAAVIILTALSSTLIGMIIGALGVFAFIGKANKPSKPPPLPNDLAERLKQDLAEIPEDWEPKPVKEAGEIHKFTIDEEA